MDDRDRAQRRKQWGERVPECVLLIGLPASGKSTFFRTRLVDTHVRVNGDMLRTAARERLLVAACLEGGISFAVDRTNVSRAERARIIAAALAAGFLVHGYFFESRKDLCLERNARRAPHERVPDAAVLGLRARLELPARGEGFDALFFVRLAASECLVEPYHEAPG